MGALAERDLTHSLNEIIGSLDKTVDARIELPPHLVRELRDLLVMVRNCAVRLSAAELLNVGATSKNVVLLDPHSRKVSDGRR